MIGTDSVGVVVQGLPKRIKVLTACTGSGMLELVVEAVVTELNEKFLQGKDSIEAAHNFFDFQFQFHYQNQNQNHCFFVQSGP